MQNRARQLITAVMLFFPAIVCSQDLSWNDTLHALVFKPPPGFHIPGFIVSTGLDYNISLSGNYLINWSHDNSADQLGFSHGLNCRLILRNNHNFELSGTLAHHLGIQYFYDSIAEIHADENRLSVKLAWNLTGMMRFTLASALNTRIFNAWNKSLLASGGYERTLSAAFLTPLVCDFSAGLGFLMKEFGSLDVGLSSARITWINDQRVFEQQGTESFYGVAKGKRSLLEYGISLHLLIDKSIGKKLRWNCDMLVFKGNKTSVDVSLNNLLSFSFFKHFKTSLQTRLFYEEKICRKIQMENLISLGFEYEVGARN